MPKPITTLPGRCRKRDRERRRVPRNRKRESSIPGSSRCLSILLAQRRKALPRFERIFFAPLREQLLHNSAAFLDVHNFICGNVIEDFTGAAGPEDLNRVSLFILAQSK